VLLGTHSVTHQQVGVKMFKKNIYKQDEIESEVKVMQALHHPNLVNLISIIYMPLLE
jgi:serine/threonine protein kinase